MVMVVIKFNIVTESLRLEILSIHLSFKSSIYKFAVTVRLELYLIRY